MGFPFAAIAGAVLPKLAGGLLADRENKKAQSAANRANKQARKYDQKVRTQDRQYFVGDRADDRAYAQRLTDSDRAYAEKMLAGDRQYASTITADDRRYAASITAGDRAYAEKTKAADYATYVKDRANMQALSDKQAERQAASRGLDFAALRDDAIAAGYNPLTAMQFANSYSREVGYGNSGSAYSGTPMGVGSTSAGGGSVPMSQPSVSHAASGGGFQANGGGYQQTFAPRLSTSSFIAEALDSGVQTYFNTIQAEDEAMYRDVAGQVARGQIAREVARQTPRNFGFDLTKVEPFKPTVGVLVPPLREPQVDLKVPFDLPNWRTGESVTQETIEQHYGGVVGEAYGIGRWADDVLFPQLDKMWEREKTRTRTSANNLGQRALARARVNNQRGVNGPRVPTGVRSYARTGTTPRGAWSW